MLIVIIVACMISPILFCFVLRYFFSTFKPWLFPLTAALACFFVEVFLGNGDERFRLDALRDSGITFLVASAYIIEGFSCLIHPAMVYYMGRWGVLLADKVRGQHPTKTHSLGGDSRE